MKRKPAQERYFYTGKEINNNITNAMRKKNLIEKNIQEKDSQCVCYFVLYSHILC